MGRNHKKPNVSLFTVTAQLVLKRRICRLWCEIALSSCSSVDYAMKLHLPSAPNEVQGPFPEAWQSSLLQLLPLKLQNSGGGGIFYLSCSSKNLIFVQFKTRHWNIQMPVFSKLLQMGFGSFTENAITLFLFLLQLPEFQATYLRFIIKSAFDHFVSVHRVIAEGTADNTWAQLKSGALFYFFCKEVTFW